MFCQQRTEIRLQELLQESDYPGAIQLLIECQQAAVTYNHFNCISELSKKLQDTQENAEEQLDVALSKVCLHFDERHYSKLQRAYQILGKTQTCMDQLLMHYASAIHNTAFSVVHGFAELCRIDEQPINLQKKQYQDLCSCLTPDIFLPCLVDLCKALWKILLSYRKLILWHRAATNEGSLSNDTSRTEIAEEAHKLNEAADLNQEYVKQKLANGSSRIWQDIQTKIKTFLLAFDFTGFKVDEFMQILAVIHKYVIMIISVECIIRNSSDKQCLRICAISFSVSRKLVTNSVKVTRTACKTAYDRLVFDISYDITNTNWTNSEYFWKVKDGKCVQSDPILMLANFTSSSFYRLGQVLVSNHRQRENGAALRCLPIVELHLIFKRTTLRKIFIW